MSPTFRQCLWPCGTPVCVRVPATRILSATTTQQIRGPFARLWPMTAPRFAGSKCFLLLGQITLTAQPRGGGQSAPMWPLMRHAVASGGSFSRKQSAQLARRISRVLRLSSAQIIRWGWVITRPWAFAPCAKWVAPSSKPGGLSRVIRRTLENTRPFLLSKNTHLTRSQIPQLTSKVMRGTPTPRGAAARPFLPKPFRLRGRRGGPLWNTTPYLSRSPKVQQVLHQLCKALEVLFHLICGEICVPFPPDGDPFMPQKCAAGVVFGERSRHAL